MKNGIFSQKRGRDVRLCPRCSLQPLAFGCTSFWWADKPIGEQESRFFEKIHDFWVDFDREDEAKIAIFDPSKLYMAAYTRI